MTDLKRCPICGSPAKVFTLIDHANTKRYTVVCSVSWHGHKEFYKTEAEAVTAWNSGVRHEQ